MVGNSGEPPLSIPPSSRSDRNASLLMYDKSVILESVIDDTLIPKADRRRPAEDFRRIKCAGVLVSLCRCRLLLFKGDEYTIGGVVSWGCRNGGNGQHKGQAEKVKSGGAYY